QLQDLAELAEDSAGPLGGETLAAFEQVEQIDPSQVLHHEVGDLLVGSGVIESNRVGMLEPPHDVDFTAKMLAHLRLTRQVLAQDFHRDFAVLVELLREIHLRHPALIEKTGHLVLAEKGLANHERRSSRKSRQGKSRCTSL